MEQQELIRRLRATGPHMRSGGAQSLFLFGSRARGDNSPDSDVDLFLDFDPAKRFSLMDLIGLEQMLEHETGLPVDLSTRASLHPRLREGIEAEAIRIF